jgi:hypothetical protein
MTKPLGVKGISYLGGPSAVINGVSGSPPKIPTAPGPTPPGPGAAGRKRDLREPDHPRNSDGPVRRTPIEAIRIRSNFINGIKAPGTDPMRQFGDGLKVTV